MWSLIKFSFFLCFSLVIFLVTWNYAHRHIPEEYQDHQAVLIANDVLDFAIEKSYPLRNSFIVTAIEAKISPPDYNKLIRTITNEQIIRIIESRTSSSDKNPLLVFIYDVECNLCDELFKCKACDIVFNDVNSFAASSAGSKMSIMAIAAVESKEELITYFATQPRGIVFKPLILAKEERNNLQEAFAKLGVKYLKTPFIVNVGRGGVIKILDMTEYKAGDLEQWLEE